MALEAKISELKDRLSHYLRRVRQGESVLVLDRDRVIARIEPAGRQDADAQGEEDWLSALERRGTVRRATQRLPKAWLSRRPKLKVDVVRSLLEEREEGR